MTMTEAEILAAKDTVNQIVPLIATAIGGNIETIFAIFYTLAIAGMFIFMVTKLMSFANPFRRF